MEVTKENFTESLPLVYSAIDNADFVAFDCEFTGLRRSTGRYNELDTAEERYVKAKDAAKDFGMIQCGLTTFRFDKKTAVYHHATFCFYLHGRDSEILVYDNSSLRFLAENGLDFNKLFKYGLPYISIQEAQAERQVFTLQSLEPQLPSPVKVAEEGAKKFLQEAESRMNKFMDGDDSEDCPLIFPGGNLTGFYRKILYNNIGAKYDNILIRPQPDSTDRSLEVRKFENAEARSKFLEEERDRKLEEKIGFTHVIQRILEKGKPLVGHNMLLDVLHLGHKTVKFLPDSLSQFKLDVCSTLPTIYDTKLISKDPPFCTDIPITALGKLFTALCSNYNPPTLELEQDGYKSHSIDADSGGKAHDAGYDAFMTGVCFLTMVKNLEGANWKKKSVIESKHLKLYANRINNMNSHDIPYFNLSGNEIVPNRTKIFCVECPTTWNTGNVYGLFNMLKPIKLVWVSSTFLYVLPLEELDMKTIKQHLKTIQAECPAQVRVRLYGDAMQPPAKRKSQNSEDTDSSTEMSPAVRDFKRLKSVGSDQMSQMSLESPSMETLPPIPTDTGKAAKSDGVFSVPDEW